jgi:hypothetical protein
MNSIVSKPSAASLDSAVKNPLHAPEMLGNQRHKVPRPAYAEPPGNARRLSKVNPEPTQAAGVNRTSR